MLQLMEEAGGIVLVGVDLGRRHLEMLDYLAKEGKPASAPPGTVLDRRTLETLGNTMDSRGVAKMLKTPLTNPSGQVRQAIILYLPNTSPEDLQRFLIRLPERSQGGLQKSGGNKGAEVPFKMVDGVYQDIPRGVQHAPNGNLRDSHQQTHASSAYSQFTPAQIREGFLGDHRVVSQLFGFITGRLMRARELHLYLLSQLSIPDGAQPPTACLAEGIFDSQYFTTELPISLYCALVSTQHYLEDLEDLLREEDGRNKALKDLPHNIHKELKIGKTRGRTKILNQLETLTALGLITPLIEATADHPHVTCTFGNSEELHLGATKITGDNSSPSHSIKYWQLNVSAPLYAAAGEGDIMLTLDHLPVSVIEEGVVWWESAKRAALDSSLASQSSIVHRSPTSITRRKISRKPLAELSYISSKRDLPLFGYRGIS